MTAWYLLDVYCSVCEDGQTYELTTNGNEWAQCPNCLRVYQCACEEEKLQMLGYADNGQIVCWNCGVNVPALTPIPGTDHYEEAW